MAARGLSKEMLDRFRASSRERLGKVQAAWEALSSGLDDESRAAEMHRNVHTLKGDARLVSYAHVAVVCQKLEDLLSISAEAGYHVPEEIDVLVSQSLDFIDLLLRNPGEGAMPGIDVDGFVGRVEDVMRGSAGRGLSSSTHAAPERARPIVERDSLTEATRARLSVAATSAFLEYLNAAGPSRTRMRSVWITLQKELQRLDSVTLVSVFERHKASVPKLAEQLGKTLRVSVTASPRLRVDSHRADALDVALLHLVRNAVDHGIEISSERRRLGKSETGVITLAAHDDGDHVAITVRDDGRGLDLEAIRNRAQAEGLLEPARAREASPLELTELLFRSGFTTRASANDVSGRGVGLDAVRDAMTTAGGTIHLKSSHDGTNVTLRLPSASRDIDVHRFPAYGGRVSLAVPTTWQYHIVNAGDQRGALVDPFERLALRAPSDETGMVSTSAPKVLVFETDSYGRAVNLVASAAPEPARGQRICPTPDSHPVEVISVEGAEVLLIRPERLR